MQNAKMDEIFFHSGSVTVEKQQQQEWWSNKHKLLEIIKQEKHSYFVSCCLLGNKK